MSITDDLREWWVRKFPVMDKELHEDFTAIADRIDEKHYDAQADAYDNGANYVFNNPTLFGLTPLPKDADGRVINIGDLMDNTHKDGFRAKRVIGIAYHEHGRTTIEVDEDRLRWHNADKLRHHHGVEDVLREFALEIDPSADIAVTGAETIKKFAAKLQLRGDGE